MDKKDVDELIIDKDETKELKYLLYELTALKQRVEELEEKIRSMEPNFF